MDHDFVRVVQHFHKYSEILRGCNTYFITLIPIKDNPISLDDFRPISLIGCVYKAISKVLDPSH